MFNFFSKSKKNNKQQAYIKELEEQLEVYEKNLQIETTNVQNLTYKNESLTLKLHAMQDDVGRLQYIEQSLLQQQQQYDTLYDEQQQLFDHYDRVCAQNKQLQEELTYYKHSVQKADTEARSKSSSLQQELTKLRDELHKAKKELADTFKTQDANEEEFVAYVNQTQQKLTDYKALLIEKDGKLAQQEQEIAQLIAEMVKLKEQSVDETIAQQQQKLAQQEQEIAELIAELVKEKQRHEQQA